MMVPVNQSKTPVARSLSRGLAILECFDADHREWTVREFAEAVKSPLASTYRVVNGLVAGGYLTQYERDGLYRLGPRLIRLGALVLAEIDIRQIALPVMERLAQSTGETTLLLVPSGRQATCIEKVEGSFAIRPRSFAIGEVVPYNAGALPMAVLAYLPPAEAEAAIGEGLAQLTGRSVVNVRALEKRRAETRRLGYAYSENEAVEGTAAIAVVLRDANGVARGSIGITGIVDRIRGREQDVVAAGQEISAHLGAVDHPADTGRKP
jgi:DNA-binding IclR family transcriptional regulator